MTIQKQTLEKLYANGLLRHELRLGVVSSVSSSFVKLNLSVAGNSSSTHFEGGRYGKGEVGEFVLIEGQQAILLGRIIEVRLPERDRHNLNSDFSKSMALDAVGQVQLLGSIALDDLSITAGVVSYPRLGDQVYAAPHLFLASIPLLMKSKKNSEANVLLTIGSIDVAQESLVSIPPEKIFGRHCAILGATGGGKSWTTARLIEECMKYQSKIILIDATGEYSSLAHSDITHCYLGNKIGDSNAMECSLPYNHFSESDFLALFNPSAGTQAPKFRQALISLRIVSQDSSLGINGFFVKTNRQYTEVNKILARDDIARIAYDPSAPFNVRNLVGQLEHECVWENDNGYGRKNEQHWGYCSTLVSRISNIISSTIFSFIFNSQDKPSICDEVDKFLSDSTKKVLRICLSGVSSEFQCKEIVTNVLGRFLLSKARAGDFKIKPVIVILDEAHNFLGRSIGNDDSQARLDAFELIAKEGRKFGLTICLATQRPRDITEGVLSQMGTLIVHRLTNDRDREVVERACGEIDRSASAFLPSLKPGEAAIIGVDFPIPLTIQVTEPYCKPVSDGPNYQERWVQSPESNGDKDNG
jgi:hypothetical protein